MKKNILVGNMAIISGALLFILIFNHYEAKAQSVENYPGDFKITSHNVYLFSRNIYPNWGQIHRADLIAQADYIKNNDVVIFNEAFDNSASDRLLYNLTGLYPHQTSVMGRSKNGWDKTEGNYSSSAIEDGGVAIVSKWPITEKIQHVFQRGGGADHFSNKGFVYVKLLKNEKTYHVIGTHLQADDSLIFINTSQTIRAEQIKEIQTFITNKNIPENEIVFIGGDMNVNYGTREYNDMITNLNVSPPTDFTGQRSTWDPTTNSILKDSYPNATPEYLDYIFVDKNHALPNNWYNKVIDIKSAQWSVTSWCKNYTYDDYSDHYPVVGSTDNN